LADLIVDGKTIKEEFKAVQCNVEGVSGFVWLRMRANEISYEDRMEPPGPVKVGELFDLGGRGAICLSRIALFHDLTKELLG
jgi:hypothetical protein